MKVKFDNWKKVQDADDHAVFKNMQGHELKISKKALSPELKSQMEEIEVHNAKAIAPKQSNPKLEESKKEPANYDDGGEVSQEDLKPYMPSKKEEDESGLPPDPRRAAYMANRSYNAAQEPVSRADGTPEDSGGEQPVDLNQMDAQGNMPGEVAIDLSNPQSNMPVPDPSSAGTSGNWDAPTAPQAATPVAPEPSQNPAQQMQTQPETLESGINQLPGVMGQKLSAAAEAEAIGKEGQQQAATLGKSVEDQQVNAKHFQDQYDALNKERLAHIQDIKNGQINPENYWKDHSKILSAIGLIIGGFNPTGSGNAGADFLNKQMDRNIEAQKANLGSKQNLLAANLHQFGNMRDATDMTRIMQGDIVSNQLKIAAAKASGPIAKARALGMAAKIDSDHAMLAQQMAMRQTLQKGAAQGQDPASFVPWIVPKEQQPAVFNEIKRAQDTQHMGDNIMNAFDEAVKDNTVAKTGAGLLRTPASVLALHQQMQPTFQDLEGTVRQAAMDNTFHNVTPRPGDMQSTINTKRQALADYVKSKMAAPMAKGYGIDLQQFRSTSADKAMRLPPAQQQYVQWARQNPNDPRAQQVLKKLGVQ